MQFDFAFGGDSTVEQRRRPDRDVVRPRHPAPADLLPRQAAQGAGLPRGDQRPARRGRLRPPLEAEGPHRVPALARPTRRRPISPRSPRRRKEVAGGIREIRGRARRRSTTGATSGRSPTSTPSATYFQYLLKRDYQAWIVLDPVITVHPDQVFFECFSKDESSYGRLGGQLRRLRGRRRVRLRHDQHRLLRGALRRVPEDPQLQDDDASRSTRAGSRSRRRASRRTRRSRSTCPTPGCAGSSRSARRWRCRR